MSQTSKVYQAQQYDSKFGWYTLKTKSGGTFCNTLQGAKSKIKGKNGKTRVVSYELTNETVEYEVE